jgi:large subunit ribosomal protein L20
MARVKRGTQKNKRRKNILKMTKGYRNARKSKKRQAKEAIVHAGSHALAHRRRKKGDFRRLWQVRISAALKPHQISYSKFIKALKDKKIELDRKILSELAKDEPETFNQVVEEVKS